LPYRDSLAADLVPPYSHHQRRDGIEEGRGEGREGTASWWKTMAKTTDCNGAFVLALAFALLAQLHILYNLYTPLLTLFEP
jgi:hypothetical protein